MISMFAQLSALFTVPGLAAAGAAAVAIPIAIHLLTRLRRRPEPWAAMRFLMQAYRKHRNRLQLEQLLLLAVRCLIVALLGFALSGPLMGGLARGLGLDGSDRLIVLVIDDSLSAQSGSRFDQLRRQPLTMLESLRPTDRVAVIRAARPTTTELSPTVDHAAAREVIGTMEPRYSRSALVEALIEADGMIAEASVPAESVHLVVVSDFAMNSVALDRPAPAALAALGQRARVMLTQPAPEAANVQIAQLTPRRHMVLAEGRTTPTVPLELRLQRFATDDGAALTGVRVVAHVEGRDTPVAELRREHRWSPGQSQAVLNIELPITATIDPSSGRGGNGSVMLSIEAQLEAADGHDALAADNQRLAVVELRQELAVGLIDERSLRGEESMGGKPTPRQWLSFALAPSQSFGDQAGPIELVSITPSALDADTAAGLDAAMVLRPDLLDAAGWDALRELAQRGGLVWFVAPAVDAPGVWTTRFRERLDIEWNIAIEPAEVGGETGTTLAMDTAVPQPLRLLSADWNALMRPVRVMRSLAVDVRGEDDHVWLRTEDQQPLLLTAPIGDGQVMLLTAALDSDWTNLPTKPLFVPLLHESLRGLLGGAGRRGESDPVAGDQPLLGYRWNEVAGLQQDGNGPRVLLSRSDQGLSPLEPLDRPGLWLADPPARGLRMAVNVDPAGGDTRALDSGALGDWFGRLGEWQWLDPANPALALAAEPARANLGWPLLWAVVALVLLETWLARWFSHAKTGGTSWLGRWTGSLRGAAS